MKNLDLTYFLKSRVKVITNVRDSSDKSIINEHI